MRVTTRHDEHRERWLERRAPRATRRRGAPRGGSRRRRAGRSASAIAFAALTPTSSAPARPGPWHAATASRSPKLDAGLDQRVRDHRRDQLDVRPARDLGHHTAEARVQIDLARHHRGADVRPSSTTAAAVSSHDVSIPRMSVTPRLASSSDRLAGDRALDRVEQRDVLGRSISWAHITTRVLVDLLRSSSCARPPDRTRSAGTASCAAGVRHAHLEREGGGTPRRSPRATSTRSSRVPIFDALPRRDPTAIVVTCASSSVSINPA